MTAFWPCPKNLPEPKFKSNGLISLVEEISRQPTIDSVPWLLVITSTWVYNAKEQAGQREIQNVQFEEKDNTGEFNVTANACVKRLKG